MGFLEGWWSKAAVGMILVQVFVAGLQLLSRVILNQGTFIFALMTYRHVVAALCVAPFAFYFDRGNNKKKLSWSIFFWLFVNALIGIIMAMGLFYYGLRDTTATYATNFLNLIPIGTFVLSTITRIEKLGVDTRAGKIKIAGAILCVAGALTFSLYKGKTFHIGHESIHHHIVVNNTNANWARGTLFLVFCVMSYAIWFILQVKLFKIYPSQLWATTITCIIAAIQSTIIGLCIDRRLASWRLGWNLQLITIAYSGALATAASFCIISWVVANKGPSYPAMFNPLALILVAILEAWIFNEEMRVGSLLGILMIMVGSYAFLWGRKNGLRSSIQSEAAGLQLEAAVMPTNSPSDPITQVEEVADNNSEAMEDKEDQICSKV